MRLLFLVPIRKESSTVKGFLDWYYWLVHLLGGTTPTYLVLRPYYLVLETELRHIPSLLRRKKKLTNPDILGTVPAEKDPDFPESAFAVQCSTWDWISKVPSEHFGYGTCIARKVLPVPGNLSSYRIHRVEFTFKVGFHRSNRRKEALANTFMGMGLTRQSDSRFPFTVFNILKNIFPSPR
ncbi:hypothetical protein PVK06_001600 [Gossypium arboreum]|uniref:Uncharacterized protein n=1 Tax=Gossypium arboreum TaxID=29729 RepID=A0ABR0R1M3_GOSAR|nr:hypothetical protein PVK06_001600 [Gossypium arboreum]